MIASRERNSDDSFRHALSSGVSGSRMHDDILTYIERDKILAAQDCIESYIPAS